MALQELGSAENVSGPSLRNIALALFSTAVQATIFETKKKVAVMNYEQCLLYREKKQRYSIENHPFGEIIPVCS